MKKKKKGRRRSSLGPPVPFFSKYHNRWIVRYSRSGKRRERKFKDQVAALEFATQIFQDQEDGIDCEDMLLGELVERFLAGKGQLSKASVADYTNTLQHAAPLAAVPIRMIRPLHLEELIDSQGTSSARQRLRGKLSMMFRQAVRWELIRRNPVEGTKQQRHKSEKSETFSMDEVQTFLEIAEPHRLVGLFDLGFTLGPRPAELFGFQWQDWDEENQTLSVNRKVAEIKGVLDIGPPKTPASIRTLSLPNHITERLEDRRKVAMIEGRAGQEDWIWPRTRGEGPIRGSNLRAGVWRSLLKAADVPYRKPYCMRHTAASTMLNGCNGVRGIALAVVSETLGHDNPQITLSRYSHVLKTDHGQVTDFWNRTIQDLKGSG